MKPDSHGRIAGEVEDSDKSMRSGEGGRRGERGVALGKGRGSENCCWTILKVNFESLGGKWGRNAGRCSTEEDHFEKRD